MRVRSSIGDIRSGGLACTSRSLHDPIRERKIRYRLQTNEPACEGIATNNLPGGGLRRMRRRLVRERVEGMARHRGLDLDRVEFHVITAPVLRLDQDRGRTRLWETVRRLRRRLLVLDPLVRLHGIDENHAGDVGWQSPR